MDRAYFQISNRAAELVRLTVQVSCNANYSEACRKASDSQLEYMAKAVEEAIKVVQGAINDQHYAHIHTLRP